jgi:hypothetical protein
MGIVDGVVNLLCQKTAENAMTILNSQQKITQNMFKIYCDYSIEYGKIGAMVLRT